MSESEADLFADDPAGVLENLIGIPFLNKLEDLVGCPTMVGLVERHDSAKHAIIKSVRIILSGGTLPPLSETAKPVSRSLKDAAAGED